MTTTDISHLQYWQIRIRVIDSLQHQLVYSDATEVSLRKMMSAEPVSTKNTTTLSFTAAVIEKEHFGLTMDTAKFNVSNALEVSLGVRAVSPRDSSFPG